MAADVLLLPPQDRLLSRPRGGAQAFVESFGSVMDPDAGVAESVLAMQRSFRDFAFEALPLVGNRNTVIKWGFHLDAMADHLQAVSDGQIRNLIMVLPPRCLKSSMLVAWSAWEWINNARIRRLSTSYDLNLAMRDNGYVRDLIKTEWYQERWGKRYALRKDLDAKMLFENTLGGRRMVSSIGSRGTGEGGERVECDDPHNALKAENEVERKRAIDWWMGTMASRVNDALSSRILTGQRVHHRDLIGSVIEAMASADGEFYERLILPMEHDPKLVVPASELRPRPAALPDQPEALVGDVILPRPLPDTRTPIASDFYQAFDEELVDDEQFDEDEELAAATPIDPPGYEGAKVAELDEKDRPSALIPRTTAIGFRDPRTVPGELLCPEQWPETEIRIRKIQLGPYRYSAQYQGAPTPSEGGQFKEKYWLRYPYDALWHRGLRPEGIFVDSAYGEEDGDPTGVSVWGTLGGRLFVMFAAQYELETPDLRRKLRDLHTKWRVPLIIEDKANGKSLLQDLRRGSDDGTIPAIPAIPFTPDGLSKIDRAFSVVSWVAGGMCLLPEDAPWVSDFVDQHKQFPKGVHDDLVDTTAMAICWLKFHSAEVREVFGRSYPAPFGAGMASNMGNGAQPYVSR